MKNKLRIQAGKPDDTSMELLPESILKARAVINDNGTNSFVYEERLVRKEKCLVDSAVDVWYEYVPEVLAEEKERALVISLHGGLMEGWGQAVTSAWTKIAEREGFVAVFPNAGTRRMWTVDYDRALEERLTAPNSSGVYMNICPQDIEDNHDAQLLLKLMEVLCEQYHIRKDRVYIHGMSMGDAMASMMARYYGNRFAGAAFTGALASPRVLYDDNGIVQNRGGSIPVFQTHMELDEQVPGDEKSADEMVIKNRQYWLKVNECEQVPCISIRQANNIAWYRGKQDYVYREVKGRDHGQTLDEAELVWDNLFDADKHTDTGNTMADGDALSIAFSEGCGSMFFGGKIIALCGTPFFRKTYRFHGRRDRETERGTFFMAAISDICSVFGCELTEEVVPMEQEIRLKDGRYVQFAGGSAACLVDGKIQAMPVECVGKDGLLFVPLTWFCRVLLNVICSECGKTVYITDHYAELSKGMSRLIRDLLKG